MRKLTGFFLAAIIALFVVNPQVALGDSNALRPMQVILADRQGVNESEHGFDLTMSLVGLASALKREHPFAFIGADRPTEALGPVYSRDTGFRAFEEQIASTLKDPNLGQSLNLGDALTETYNYLVGQRAPRESTVYLVVGGVLNEDPGRVDGNLTPIVGMFEESGWPIVGLTLPGTSPAVRELLREISTDSGGALFELSVPDGLRNLSDKILRDEARGSLAQLGEGILSSNSVLTSTLEIAPGTHEATLLFFKQGRYGSLRLTNPSGFEASAGDRSASSVIETPHVVVWQLIDPAPGKWSVTVRGIEGLVSAWQYTTNKYSPVLISFGTLPLDEPFTLAAFVTDGRTKVNLEGVALAARITTPEGTTLFHKLNDEGVSGDALSGDGYFSATIPPFATIGDYKLELELAWPELAHKVSSQFAFGAEAFPTLDITPVATANLEPGKRSKVATVLVHIRGQPYPVAQEELTSAMASNGAGPGVLEIKPQKLLDQGRAWAFDVFFTPKEETLHTLAFRLKMEYAGSQYTYTSDSVVLSSVMPSPPPVPAVPLPVAPEPEPPALPVQPPGESAGFPWRSLIISLVVVAGLAAAAAYWRNQAYPRGYLYDDRNNLVVDFAGLRRRPIMKLLFKSSVWGKELGVQGLESVTFRFLRDSIGLRGRRSTPTVRVNNHPLVRQTAIEDRAWIGARGRLYSFFLAPPAKETEPGLGNGG